MYKKKQGPNVWVVKSGQRFTVKEEGIGAALVPPMTQGMAIVIARLLARANGSELIVQSRTGTIQRKDSHGADRFPPRG